MFRPGMFLLKGNKNSFARRVALQVLAQVWFPNVPKVMGQLERKICAVGLTRLLCGAPSMVDENHIQIWGDGLVQLLKLLELPEEQDQEDIEDEYVS